MASDEVKLLGAWASPFVARARIALNLKCVGYEFHEEKFGSKSDLLLKSNPVYKKIPVLIHGDMPICESLIIVQYIEEVWASRPAILPSDPYDRATARFWTTYIDQTWYPSIRSIMMADDAKKASLLEEANRGVALLEEAFTKISRGQKFFGGDKMGYIDIGLGCFLSWIRVIQIMANVSLIDESKAPKLSKWAHHFSAHDAVKDVLPQTDRLMEFAKMLVAKTKA